MFTGIIEEVGKVTSIKEERGTRRPDGGRIETDR